LEASQLSWLNQESAKLNAHVISISTNSNQLWLLLDDDGCYANLHHKLKLLPTRDYEVVI